MANTTRTCTGYCLNSLRVFGLALLEMFLVRSDVFINLSSCGPVRAVLVHSVLLRFAALANEQDRVVVQARVKHQTMRQFLQMADGAVLLPLPPLSNFLKKRVPSPCCSRPHPFSHPTTTMAYDCCYSQGCAHHCPAVGWPRLKGAMLQFLE